MMDVCANMCIHKDIYCADDHELCNVENGAKCVGSFRCFLIIIYSYVRSRILEYSTGTLSNRT
jgi:hypothetical protein